MFSEEWIYSFTYIKYNGHVRGSLTGSDVMDDTSNIYYVLNRDRGVIVPAIVGNSKQTRAQVGNSWEVVPRRLPLQIQPTNASLYLTSNCNLACKYCYIAPYKKEFRNELPTDAWKRVLDILYDYGVRFVNFIGGEPLLRKDLAELIGYADDIGYAGIELSTNATLLDRNHALIDMVKNLKANFVIDTSLDSSLENQNNAVRGAYKQVLSGIRYVVDQGVMLSVASVVTNANYESIPSFVKFLVDLGVKQMQLNTLIPIEPGQKPLYIDDRELLWKISESCRRLKDEYKGRISLECRLGLPVLSGESDAYVDNVAMRETSFSGCPATRREVYVLPDGRLIACPMFISKNMFMSAKSILDDTFENIWVKDGSINEFRRGLLQPTDARCEVCKYGEICRGGCKALAYYISGSIDKKDPRCTL